jgi:hypothetical protein
MRLRFAYLLLTLMAMMCAACSGTKSSLMPAGEIECPTSIKTMQTPRGTIAGWKIAATGDQEKESALIDFEIFAGDPRDLSRMYADNDDDYSRDGPKDFDWIWSFYPTDEKDAPVTLVCSYGGTDITLIRPLARNLTQCTASYKAHHDAPYRIVCR